VSVGVSRLFQFLVCFVAGWNAMGRYNVVTIKNKQQCFASPVAIGEWQGCTATILCTNRMNEPRMVC
jgi:hypothetical protein